MPLYEEIEIEDMTYDPETMTYTYPCPCGDKFKITLEALWDGEDVADCQSCTLFINVIYDEEDLPPLPDASDDDEDDDDGNNIKTKDETEEEKKSVDNDKDHSTKTVVDAIATFSI